MKAVQGVSERSAWIGGLVLATILATAGSVVGDDSPTQGCLFYTDPESGIERRFPLEHTDVDISISGTVAEVTLLQRFSNPLETRIEAVYVFPLPDRAAVDAMTIVMGDRRIVGEIHRREEARRIYDEARQSGHLTGLLDQERPNIFTQRLANILPGEEVEVEIHYVEDLTFDHGTWRLVFPAVVGPRYIPGAATGRSGSGWSPDTDQVSDASRITPPVLRPGERSGHDIDITVSLEPGFAIHDLSSSSHEIRTIRHDRKRATVRVAPLDTIPNKDFVLGWTTGGAAIQSTTVAHKEADDGYLTLILQPPAQPSSDQVVPREVVFVLDTSGSMRGEPMAACKQLVRKALMKLRADDTFRLIHFAGRADQLDPNALPVSRANIQRALSFLDGMRGSGGTEMLAGVRAALDAPKDPYRLRMVLFLTDGYIGNEEAIIKSVSERIGDARVFSLGIGTSVNRYLLDRLAEVGRGRAEYLRPGESPDTLVQRYYDRITDPVFTQLELDWGGLEVVDVEPAQLPDLFAAQPLLVHARYRTGGRGTVTLRGWAGRERVEVSSRVRLPEREPENASQAQLWARGRIARLEMEKIRSEQQQAITEQITALALEHRLMTAYTSFVAVDKSEVRDQGELTTVDQPLPMPEGVSYEGVFGKAGGDRNVRAMMSVPGKTKSTLRHPQTSVQGLVPDNNLVMGMPDAPPPRNPEGPMRFVVGGAMTEPVKLTGAGPVYPEAARRARIQGVVVLELTIDTEGRVTQIHTLRPLPLGLTEAAVAAIRTWQFQPSILNGQPVALNYIMTVRFHLDSTPAVAAESAKAVTKPDPIEIADSAPETHRDHQPAESNPRASAAVSTTMQPDEPSRTPGSLTRFNVPVLTLSLVLLVFATGAWLFERRVVAH